MPTWKRTALAIMCQIMDFMTNRMSPSTLLLNSTNKFAEAIGDGDRSDPVPADATCVDDGPSQLKDLKGDSCAMQGLSHGFGRGVSPYEVQLAESASVCRFVWSYEHSQAGLRIKFGPIVNCFSGGCLSVGSPDPLGPVWTASATLRVSVGKSLLLRGQRCAT